MSELGSTDTTRGLNLSPEWTVEDVVQRYPLSLQFFHTRGFPGETSQQQLSMQLQDFADYHNIKIGQLEDELKDHLIRAVQPDNEDCERNLCYLLLFCPDEFKETLLDRLQRWIPFVKEE